MGIYDLKSNKIYLEPRELLDIARGILEHVSVLEKDRKIHVEFDIDQNEENVIFQMDEREVRLPLKKITLR